MDFFLIALVWVLTGIALWYIISIKNGSKSKTLEEWSDEAIIWEEDDMEDEEETVVKICFIGDKAFWVHKNVFYEADVTVEPDFESAKPVDIDSLSEEQMKILFKVLDTIGVSDSEG